VTRILAGTHPVLEALAAGRRGIELVLTSEEPIAAEAKRRGVPCERRSRAELDEIVGQA
jgi:tRNA G18 (ribose-2'-O)-methylase SpoU